MKKLFLPLSIFIAVVLFSPITAAAQKHSKKDKTTEAPAGDSTAEAAPVPDKKKKSKKEPKTYVKEIQVPDTSAEEMPVPEPTGLVSDFGNVFSQGQEDTLAAMIKSFHDSTKDEIVIVAWDTLHLVPEDMDAYVHKLSASWEIGDANRNNGIIIAFSVQLRKIRIESAAGGLTEKESWDIVHKIMLPYFMNKNYYGGTMAGLRAVIKRLNSE